MLGVAPKSYLPTYREFYEALALRLRRRPAGGTITVAGAEVPFGPDLVFRGRRRARPARCTSRSARTCGCRCRPAPRPPWPAPPCWPTSPARPITVARAEDRRLLVRSASARCLAAYVYAAAGEGESSTDLSWDGQTMVYECGDLLGESERFPDGPAAHRGRRRPRPDPPGAAAPGHLRRQPPARTPRECFREVALHPRPADRRHRPAPQGRPLPVRPRRRRAAGAGLLRGLQHPGLRARAAAAGDRPAEGRHRRLRRPRLDPRADRRGARRWTGWTGRAATSSRFTLPGFATGETTKSNATRLVQGARRQLRGDRHPARRRQMLDDLGHPFAARRGGLRRDLRERPGRAAHRLPVPDRQPARRHRPRHRRPLRAGARLVHLRRRRPDVALRGQLRGARRPSSST